MRNLQTAELPRNNATQRPNLNVLCYKLHRAQQQTRLVLIRASYAIPTNFVYFLPLSRWSNTLCPLPSLNEVISTRHPTPYFPTWYILHPLFTHNQQQTETHGENLWLAFCVYNQNLFGYLLEERAPFAFYWRWSEKCQMYTGLFLEAVRSRDWRIPSSTFL